MTPTAKIPTSEKMEIVWSQATTSKKPVLSSKKTTSTRKNTPWSTRQTTVAKNRKNSLTNIKTTLQQKFKKMALVKQKLSAEHGNLQERLKTDQEMKEVSRQQSHLNWKIRNIQRKKRFLASQMMQQKQSNSGVETTVEN